jgi:type II secretory pathway component PulF
MNYGATNRVAERAAATARALADGSKSAPSKSSASNASRPAPAPIAPKPLKKIPRFSKPVRGKELANLTSQLAIMAKSGVDVASALQSLSRQCTHPTLKSVLFDVHENVLAGNSLSDSLLQYPTVFDHTFVASVAAGEASGRLPDVLQQLALLLRTQLKLRNSLRAMLAYPVLLTMVSSCVLLALILFVLPRFADIFADFEAPLPVITQILIAVSSELRNRFWLWIPIFSGLVVGAIAFKRSPRGRALWDRFTLQAPVFRDVTRMLLIGRSCRLLGLMVESGVPLLESIRLTRSSVKNLLFRQLFQQLEDDVLNGRGLTHALTENAFVPGAAAEMIMTAEKTGSIGPVTTMVGQHFEEEGEAKLKELVSIAEPVITVVMGLVVAVIVMSVMLPLFDLSSAAGKGH